MTDDEVAVGLRRAAERGRPLDRWIDGAPARDLVDDDKQSDDTKDDD